MTVVEMAERGWLPDPIIRFGIRRLLRTRIDRMRRLVGDPSTLSSASTSRGSSQVQQFAGQLRRQPIAVHAPAANQQHYEISANFFARVLGPHWKYSCGFWPDEDTTLEESERAMLALSCQRARLEDGMRVLDLGCGWGSLSLFIAERFPTCQVVGLSNSAAQRTSIERRIADRGIKNLQIVTADVAQFETSDRFDRVLSIEMFEHMRNYELLLRRISGWLAREGQLFVHIFCHRNTPYTFETADAADVLNKKTRAQHDWMARHFFTGGQMPSFDLLHHFQDDLSLEQTWQINGSHYARTCRAWLDQLDSHHSDLLPLLAETSSPRAAKIQLQRWRMFMMACEELFGFGNGDEWFVAHYRFAKR